MRRSVLLVLSLILLILLASCATQADPSDIRGIWKAKDGSEEYLFYFTSDGYYAQEFCWEGMCLYSEIGTYALDMDESGEGVIATESYDFYCVREGSKLTIDFYGVERVFTRTSKIAKNNTSASALKGVWSDGVNVTGFSSNGLAVTMGRSLGLQDYYVEITDYPAVVIDGYSYPYLIINNRLFIQDDNGFLGMYTCAAMDRQSSAGTEQTSREILVNVTLWPLTDTSDGTAHFDYSFLSDGRYSMKYYSDYDPVGYTSSGTFTYYYGNRIELSNDSDLAYAIIDGVPFMFSI